MEGQGMMWNAIPTAMVCLDQNPRTETMQALCRVAWHFGAMNLYPAINGARVGIPPWFGGTPGAWGCWRSHLELWERMLSDDTTALAVFEDDVVTHAEPTERTRLADFLAHVPDDWDMVYLGGQVWAGPCRSSSATACTAP